jgi:hypothetical protein
MVAKHPVDTVACDCIAEPVEEDRFFGRAVVHEGEQRVDGCWPERAPAYLAALASELYVARWLGMRLRSPIRSDAAAYSAAPF